MQVIAARSKQQRRRARRSAAKSGLVGAPGSEKVAPAVRTQARPDAPNAEKIIVSNLPTDVNEAQIKVSNLIPLLVEWHSNLFFLGAFFCANWTDQRGDIALR